MRPATLNRHMVTHSTEVFKCTKCSYTTSDSNYLNRHIRQRHNSLEKTRELYSCKHCNYCTLLQGNFKRHQKCHLDCNLTDFNGGNLMASLVNGTDFHCTICSFQTPKKSTLQRHYKSVHVGRRSHLCHLCGMSFKREDALKQHTNVVHNLKKSLKFKCTLCSRAFKSMVRNIESKKCWRSEYTDAQVHPHTLIA